MKTTKHLATLIFLILLSSLTGIAFPTGDKYCANYIKLWGLVKYKINSDSSKLANMDSIFLNDIKNLINCNKNSTYVRAINAILDYSIGLNHVYIEKAAKNTIKLDDTLDIFLKSIGVPHKNQRKINLALQSQSAKSPYVMVDPESMGSKLINEKRYITPFPSIELRLLALARFWNAINYFYPHKRTISTNWDANLTYTIRKLIEANDEYEYSKVISRLICSIEDEHGTIYSYSMKKHYGFFQLPIYASYYNGKVYVTKLINTYSENSFHFGDIIQSINGLSFEEYYNQDSSYVWGSNYNRKRNTALENYIKLQKEERTVVKVLRNDTLLELVCLPIKIESIKTNNIVNYCNSKDYLLGSNFLYLDLSKIDSSNFEKLIRSGNKPYLIIDLRTYPNWVLTQISDLFSQDTVPFAAYRSPVITNPGAFGSPNRIYLKPKKDSNKVQYTKIILMVDYTTISRGEFIGMALQALPNVLTFGNSTAGADGNVTKIHLPGNISTQFTGLEILYPTGKETQKIGINVDIKYELTGKGFLQGYDEALAFLIENIIMEGN